jgi:hypothetical protein
VFVNRFYPQIINCVFALTLLSILGLSACNKASSGTTDKVPSIFFTGLSIDSLQASSEQTLNINFNFSDGDGDLGNKASSGNFDIYTRDLRNDSMTNYFFPQALPSVIEAGKGISGTCTLTIDAAFIALSPNRPLRDTMRLEVYIKDRAGHESNRIITPNIYLSK